MSFHTGTEGLPNAITSPLANTPCGMLPHVTWVEVVGLLGVVATLVGLYLTWRQAKDARVQATAARTAADAASSAIDRTQRQLRSNQMLVLIPQLRWVAQEMDAAIESGDKGMTRRHLDSWRYQAGHVNGLLLDDSAVTRKVLKAIQDSVALATEATTTLLREDKKTVLESCEQARHAIGHACNLLNVFVGQSASQVPAADTEEAK